MGVKAVRRVLEHSRATGTDRLVLVILAEYADDQKCVCWPSVATIAKEAKVRARAAEAALCALQETGEIEVEIHGARYPKTRRQYRPNLYRVTVAASLVVHQATPLVPI